MSATSKRKPRGETRDFGQALVAVSLFERGDPGELATFLRGDAPITRDTRDFLAEVIERVRIKPPPKPRGAPRKDYYSDEVCARAYVLYRAKRDAGVPPDARRAVAESFGIPDAECEADGTVGTVIKRGSVIARRTGKAGKISR